MRKLVLVIVSIMISGALFAQDTYTVDFTILNNSELIGVPSIIVKPDTETSVSVSNRYKVSLKIEEREDETVYIPLKLNINGKDYAPSLIVKLDNEASIKVGEMKLSVFISKTRT